MDINTIALVGHVTERPEIRELNDIPVADLELGVRSHGKNNGDWVERVDTFQVEVFGKQADHCADYLRAGSPVGIAGRLQNRAGKVRIVAQNVQFIAEQVAA